MGRSNDEDRRVKILEGKIRELKALNRALHRKLRRINKGYHKLRGEPEVEEEVAEKPLCPECSSPIKTHELMGRSWEYCGDCGWKSKTRVK